MRNSWKVAKWELKRNMKNKSFIISLFLTPILFLVFATVPALINKLEDNKESERVTVYIHDELGVYDDGILKASGLDWDVKKTMADHEDLINELENKENAAYIPLTESSLNEGTIFVYTSEGVDNDFLQEVAVLEPSLRQMQYNQIGLTQEEIEMISTGILFEEADVKSASGEASLPNSMEDMLERIVPGVFAGIVLFSIVITGMMIFQSASQEKKEKVAEIILSSLTPEELMNGKIIGYFMLGIIQVFVWFLFAVPITIGMFDIPVLEYLLVPETILLLFIAIAGYLLFASIFVSIGATVEDMTATSNFQGMVMMLPFLPFILMGPVISNPEGLTAMIGTYFPITAPGILLLRLSLLDQWPWIQIIISLSILVVSIILFMKLAGKIFKTGILMYGKNASVSEIWKWIRQ